MNLDEVTFHGTDSIYLLVSTKYRNPVADAERTQMLRSGNLVIRRIDMSKEQILRSAGLVLFG